jgi:CHAT domain-containing protein
MLRGKVTLEGGKLITPSDRVNLPASLAQKNTKLTHPFYWAGFTIVGNPW